MTYLDTSGIYRILHIPSGRIYIGSSINVKARWSRHKSELRLRTHVNLKLQNSWNKHGESEFLFEVIEFCAAGTLIDREQFWIDELKPHYNLKKIAGTRSGNNHTPESKMKMSISHKGLHHTVSSIERIKESKSIEYIVIDPFGISHETNRLKEFCIEHNLTYQIMSGVANGIYPHHKKWKCFKKVYFDFSN